MKALVKADKKSIAVPDQVALLAEAMQCDNEEAAKLLIKRALNVSYHQNNSFGWGSEEVDASDDQITAVVSMIRGVNPRDSTEAILAAQFVALNLQGMQALTESSDSAKGHAMQMIRLSHQSLDMLQRYRGKNPTVNFNYNVLNQGEATLNTLIQTGKKEKIGA